MSRSSRKAAIFIETRHCEGSEAIQFLDLAGLLRRYAPRNDEGVKHPAVYIMANRRNGTLYTGVTSDLVKRVWQHREGQSQGFTYRYGCKLLVWYELSGSMEHAILREKQMKAGSRAKKIALIEGLNPAWADLWSDIAHP
jgi:putative endonuclease